MAWIKIPPEHHPLFRSALPTDKRISTVNMFGGIAAKVKGRMFAGLFARTAIVKLSPADQKEALALDGAVPFDPMGNGRVMSNTVQLPDEVMENTEDLESWLRRAFDYAVTLPEKKKKPATPMKKKPAPKKKAKKR
jgi:TfoX/Sxy family transcriptional regulator of competence genes